MITADQCDELKSILLAGKVKPDSVSTEWAYQRAWNDGIDFSIRQIEKQKDQHYGLEFMPKDTENVSYETK